MRLGCLLLWCALAYGQKDEIRLPPELRVTNADTLVDSVRAAGGSLISLSGPLGAKPGSVFVRDPNGFLIELIQR